MKSTTLYFKSGNSDKVYQAWIEEEKEGKYTVNFAFGRRGNTLQTGTKTTSPVPLVKAESIYTKLLDSKRAKGYTEGEDVTPYTGTTKEEKVSGLVPQLLNPITESDALELINNPNIVAQEKYDGKRLLLQINQGGNTAINRKGLYCGAPSEVLNEAESLSSNLCLDGESVGDKFYVFDLLQFDGKNTTKNSYSERLTALEKLFHAKDNLKHLVLAPTARTSEEKRKLVEQLKSRNAEGVVFKDITASYSGGRPNSGGPQTKFKFVATASAVVESANQTKRSVSLYFLDGDKKIESGKVTIPPNHSVPSAGAVVEIRYLYAMPSHALYQPVYLGERDDISPEECQLKQLKYKA